MYWIDKQVVTENNRAHLDSQNDLDLSHWHQIWGHNQYNMNFPVKPNWVSLDIYVCTFPYNHTTDLIKLLRQTKSTKRDHGEMLDDNPFLTTGLFLYHLKKPENL